MKILWFTNNPCSASEILNPNSQGGGWLSALEKCLASSQLVDLHICFQWDNDIPSFSAAGVTYHPLRRVRIKEALLNKILGKELKTSNVESYLSIISTVNPDLIHVHGTEEGFGLIQDFTNVPVVISIQGILSNYIFKYFAGISPYYFLFSENIVSHIKLKSILTNYLIFKSNVRREKKIFLSAAHVIGRTHWDHASTMVLAPKAKYYHGDEILRQIFYEKSWISREATPTTHIVTVSSGAPYKGFETILQVSRILNEQVGMKFTWTVIGLTATDSIVKAAYNWLGAQSSVNLVGVCNGHELRDILLNSDIFCQVSHIENSANSLCEAMLIGMPIVASFVGGTDSMLDSPQEGLLVQEGDPLAIAGAILKLTQAPKLAATMGEAARVRARIRHNPEKVVSDLLAIYRLILE